MRKVPGISKHDEQTRPWGPVFVLWECGGGGGHRAFSDSCWLVLFSSLLPALPPFLWLLNYPEVDSLLSPHSTCTATIQWATPGPQLGYPKPETAYDLLLSQQ